MILISGCVQLIAGLREDLTKSIVYTEYHPAYQEVYMTTQVTGKSQEERDIIQSDPILTL